MKLKYKTKKKIATGLSVVLSCAMAMPGLPIYAQTVTANSSNQTYSDSSSGGHAVYVSGSTVTLTNPTITKTGDSSSEDADFYGTNAAVLAEKDANLTIQGGSITTDGAHANGLFSYGTATVNVSDTTITTKGNNSGGIMITGGAAMNASNLTISTSGNSSAAIRSDRGGGDVNVSGGSYKTSGTGSPVIYSTADIDVENASLESSASEGVVIEGGNSVSLKDCTVVGDNTKLNGQAKNYDTIFIYQSMSGDASEGTSEFSAEGGSITSKNGDTFFVTNTTTKINLTNTTIKNADNGDLLAAESAAWGKSGSNGGNVTLTTSNQKIEGDIEIDSISTLNLKMNDGSSYKGAINESEDTGSIAVIISDDSSWTLTGDSHIDSLDCDEDAIELNGHTLYVNGQAYTEGTGSEGQEIEMNSGSGSNSGNESGNNPPSKPGDTDENGGNQGQQPPQKPEGEEGQQPPQKPEGEEGQQPPQKPEGEEGQQPPQKPEGEEGQQPQQKPEGEEGQQPPTKPEGTDGNGGSQNENQNNQQPSKENQNQNSQQTPGANQNQNGNTNNNTPPNSGQKNENTTASVKRIKISGASKNIAAGKKIQLTVKTDPENAKVQGISFSSSNTKYATVDANGLVTTKAAGKGKKVVITASNSEGKAVAKYTIKIRKGIVKSVKIKGKSSVKAGRSITLKTKVKASSGAYKKVAWTSDNTNYATVNARGKVKAKKAGKGQTVTITATALDGSGKKASKTITIK